jgi:plasmid stabilization system protein ParE
MNEPRWHPGAIQDVVSSRDWYAQNSAIAARGFLLALDHAVHAVIDDPKRWPVRSHGCRGYTFRSGYPFTLVYRLTSQVEIVAVAHQRRHSQYWRDR